ncbi:M48 family metallopeptidase [uncultured Aquimonas sp.]|uniref:M48 family metallopeptidase n=1 Tax=uncultured Aquimonas sp. TaxID=385483 RepID=UPI00086B8FB6|nr:M48 family metallopeptidase [uncultured Aquimonas sp.]ODU41317.1 MAG: hypothetical protein ABS96_32275 [Xanthomonadaceae bacterium SCN 69-123]
MDSTRHIALVEQLQVELKRYPLRYRVKLVLLSLAGFAAVVSPLLLATLCLGATVVRVRAQGLASLADGWALIVLALGLLALRALWLRIPPPIGHLLQREEAPRLREMVEDLRVAAGAPRLAGIVITDELNAAVVSLPRVLGLPWSRHYLLLGLPLMQQLEADALRAVIAHELGHFHGGRGRLAGWIYRLRQTWGHVHFALNTQRMISALPVVLFLDWYEPYFEAYSFVLAREDEKVADACALRLAGPQAAGEALLLIALAASRWQRSFLPALQRLNRRRPEPIDDYFEEMRRQLSPGPEDAEQLPRLLREAAGPRETHPSLRERLRAAGIEPPIHLPPRVRRPASGLLDALEARLMREWSIEHQAWMAEDWKAGFEQAEEERRRLQALEARIAGGEGLGDAELAEHARLQWIEGEGRGELVPLLTAAERCPEDALLRLTLGRALQEREDPRCLDHLQAALRLDPNLGFEALPLLESFHLRRGDTAAARALQTEFEAFDTQLRQDARARTGLQAGDLLQPHGLEADALTRLLGQLREDRRIKRVWLVRKQLPQPLGPPHFVLVVDWRWFRLLPENALQALSQRLQLPGTLSVYDYDQMPAGLSRIVVKTAGPPVYRRADTGG